MAPLHAKIMILVLAAYLPPIIYMIWIRNTEKYEKEPWGTVLKVFLWGAFIATLIAAIMEVILLLVTSRALSLRREYEYLAKNPNFRMLLLVCVIAPIAEECTKALGVFLAKRQINELEDGLVYGASAGLGFAAMENLLYDFSAMSVGVLAFVMVAFLRAISSTLLHASATAMTGYGIAHKIVYGFGHILPYYFAAVLMHALFNFLASISLIFGGAIPLLGVIAAIIFALSSIKFVRRKIIALDRRNKRRSPLYGQRKRR